MVYVNLNHSCNNKCKFCANGPQNMGDLTKDEVIAFLDTTLNEDKKVLLSGGEPTVWKDVVELVDYATHSFDAEVYMISNARRFSDLAFLKQIEKAGLKFVWASLYGYNRETHNELTGSDSYEETVTGIENLRQSGIGVEVRTLVSKVTAPYLSMFLRNFKELFSDLTLCLMAFEIDGLAVLSKEEFAPRFSETKKPLEEAFALAESLSLRVEAINFPLCAVGEGYRKYLRQYHFIRDFYIGRAYISVSSKVLRLEWDNLGKPEICTTCSLSSQCSGAAKSHLTYYSTSELRPV